MKFMLIERIKNEMKYVEKQKLQMNSRISFEVASFEFKSRVGLTNKLFKTSR